MYYFYACQSVNLDVWWKKHLTKGQIVQFIVGNVGNISWSYYKQYQGLDCDGSWFGFWYDLFIYRCPYNNNETQKDGRGSDRIIPRSLCPILRPVVQEAGFQARVIVQT